LKPGKWMTVEFSNTSAAVWNGIQTALQRAGFMEEHLRHLPVHFVKNQKTTAIIELSPKILYDRLISLYLVRCMPVPIDAADFQYLLKSKFTDFIEIDGMYFLPELKMLLEENFIQLPDGSWRTPDIHEAKDREAMRNIFLKNPMMDEMVECETGRIVFQPIPEFLLEVFRNISKNWDVWLKSIPQGATSIVKIFLDLFQESGARTICRKIGFKLFIP